MGLKAREFEFLKQQLLHKKLAEDWGKVKNIRRINK
jgi:hypothetical protein